MMYVSEKTKRIRHSIVRLIAPTIYYEAISVFPRPMTVFLSNQSNAKPLIGVEIGVAEGVHAKSILDTLPISKLYLIDSFYVYMEKKILQDKYSKLFLSAKKNLSDYQNKVVFIKKRSEDSTKDVPDELDFVYIDGCHDYKAVKRDLENYYPKIRKGGIIGGHDFNSIHVDVCKAVVEFSLKHNLKLNAKKWDWWMIKEGVKK